MEKGLIHDKKKLKLLKLKKKIWWKGSLKNW